jgi:hypothetical protein
VLYAQGVQVVNSLDPDSESAVKVVNRLDADSVNRGIGVSESSLLVII